MQKTITKFKIQFSPYLQICSVRTQLYGDEIWLPHRKTPKIKKTPLAKLENETLFDLVKNRYIDLKEDLTKFKNPQKGTLRLEGAAAIRDAITAGCNLKRIYFTNRNVLQALPKPNGEIEFFFIRPQGLKQLSSSKHPQSIIADAQPVQTNVLTAAEYWEPLPLFIVLDSVQDPRNIGMIFRTATVFGISTILLLNGCADPWNTNSVRAGMSAQLQIPFQTRIDWKILFNMANSPEAPTTFHVADIAPKATDMHINSALDPQPETLNEDLDSDLYDDTVEQSSNKGLDISKKSFSLPLSTIPHFAHDYFPLNQSPRQKVGIIFGNESRGVSPSAYHLAHFSGGKRLFIPASPSLSSLNVSMAVSSILAEAQRQYIMREKLDKMVCNQ
ncbi:RNA methyltransferase like 1 [Cichlidogyrus casuarinus]|uniref:RNA methyltransferase like 1 n=1 Tax=Cichlidogyrus casuarinus TaxID=1844966 RepID=A0ABD2Q2J6_9PLAT